MSKFCSGLNFKYSIHHDVRMLFQRLFAENMDQNVEKYVSWKSVFFLKSKGISTGWRNLSYCFIAFFLFPVMSRAQHC